MLNDVLRQRLDAVQTRWVEAALSVYPARSTELIHREQDRFANPIGHAVRTGTRTVLEGLCDGVDDEQLIGGLRDAIRIRAVQQLPPSGALAFVLALKPVLRSSLADQLERAGAGPALAGLEERIDRLALAAFDVYVGCREQLLVLRAKELERSTSWLEAKLRSRVGRLEEP